MSDREQLIRDLFPLVKKIARRVARVVGGIDIDELVGDGSVGLIRAVDSFDPAYGVALETYARRIITGAMLNGIRRLDPVSERVRRTVRVGEQARYALASERGRVPTDAEMAARIPGLERARAHTYRGTPLSLDTPFPAGERLTPALGNDPQALLLAADERVRIHRAVAALPARQRRVIVDHYFADHSLRNVSALMAISPQRASQLHLVAIAKLRRALASGG